LTAFLSFGNKWIKKGWEVQSLSFKPVPVERKVKVIYRVVKGEKIQPIARGTEVSMNVIKLGMQWMDFPDEFLFHEDKKSLKFFCPPLYNSMSPASFFLPKIFVRQPRAFLCKNLRKTLHFYFLWLTVPTI
jgi:hypothetical protein